jgi:uncharacterized membrane protein
MAKILGNFHLALLIGLVLLIAAMFGLHGDLLGTGVGYWSHFLRYLHIFAGILWIGLLYYFNFVQTPVMPKVPAELKPGINKYIAPVALFWFRWAAVATVVIGLILAESTQPGYIGQALTFKPGHKSIGIGMWLGLIMAANVWFVIWPNQKRVLGIVPAEDDVKARSATMGMMASRINLILSIPMLYCMVMQAHISQP